MTKGTLKNFFLFLGNTNKKLPGSYKNVHFTGKPFHFLKRLNKNQPEKILCASVERSSSVTLSAWYDIVSPIAFGPAKRPMFIEDRWEQRLLTAKELHLIVA